MTGNWRLATVAVGICVAERPCTGAANFGIQAGCSLECAVLGVSVA